VEFEADPKARDRAIATVLYESMMLGQTFGEIATTVKQGGIGGLLKAVMSNGKA
jgi:hypothetical protein